MAHRPAPLSMNIDGFLHIASRISRVGSEGRDHWGQIYSVEGNIGAGKSWMLSQIAALAPDLDVRGEPLDKLVVTTREGERVDLLEQFYADQARRAFSFQCAMFTKRLGAYLDALRDGPHHKTIVSERSLMTDKLFASMLHKDGVFDAAEFEIYCAFYAFYLGSLPNFTPRGVVYVRTPVDVCYARVQQRARRGEKKGDTGGGVSQQYLQRLHEEHEALIADLSSRGIPVLEIDGSRSKEEFATVHAPRVVQFVRELAAHDRKRIEAFYSRVVNEHSPMSTSPLDIAMEVDQRSASPTSPYVTEDGPAFLELESVVCGEAA